MRMPVDVRSHSGERTGVSFHAPFDTHDVIKCAPLAFGQIGRTRRGFPPHRFKLLIKYLKAEIFKKASPPMGGRVGWCLEVGRDRGRARRGYLIIPGVNTHRIERIKVHTIHYDVIRLHLIRYPANEEDRSL